MENALQDDIGSIQLFFTSLSEGNVKKLKQKFLLTFVLVSICVEKPFL